MRIAMIGLGKMGMNMALKLKDGGHAVFAFDRDKSRLKEASRKGIKTSETLDGLAGSLGGGKSPKVVWIMLPSGPPVYETIKALKALLKKGDMVIDGGNSRHTDDAVHAATLGGSGIHYMDAGVSGGIKGRKQGYCIMCGGEEGVYKTIVPALKTLCAPKGGYIYCGKHGAGHFVKMVHNGIEYGMMSAYAEGFALIKASKYKGASMSDLAGLWNKGSVIRSWLLELIQSAFMKDPDLSGLEPYVEDSGEGRWCVQHAVDSGVPAPVITASLYGRFGSRGNAEFGDKLLAAMRREFGGHAVKTASGKTLHKRQRRS